MNIIVCLKRVPDTGARLEIEKGGLEIKPDVPWILNPFDEFAVEEAIRIRERFGGKVTLINASPDGGEEVLKKGIATGADDAVYVKDTHLRGLDEIDIAKVLSSAISGMAFDIILCGKQGTDSGSGIVGGALAGLLNIPLVSAIKKLDIFPKEKRAEAFREVEWGTERIECFLPALFTATRGLNEPRYPALSGIMKAKKQEIKFLDLSAIGIDTVSFLNSRINSRIKRKGLSYPLLKRKRVILDGDTRGEVREAIRFLKDEVKIL